MPAGEEEDEGQERKEDDSLVCQEDPQTIPRSPVHPGTGDTSPQHSATTGDRARLEMPFATVPESVGGSRGGAKPGGIPASLAAPDSPPGNLVKGLFSTVVYRIS